MALLRRLLFVFLPALVFAQPDSGNVISNFDALKSIDLDQSKVQAENTVTLASRLPADLKDISYTSFIITSEQIRQRGYSTLVDVLKDLPGIKVSQPGSAVHGETFLMRGLFGNYYVKILVDDLPIQPSATSGMPIGMQLPVQQAERIEVLYGPAAALYGADAMAGVINIVTRKADKLQMLDADLQIGFPGTWKFDAMLGGKFAMNNRVWNYMIYGGVHQFNDMPITSNAYDEVYNPSNYVPAGEEDLYLNSPFYSGSKTKADMSFLPNQSEKFGFRFGNKKLSFGMDYGKRTTHSAIGSNPIYKLYNNPTMRFGEQISRFFISYKTDFGKWFSQTNFQLLNYEIDPSSKYATVDNPTNFEGEFYQYGASNDLYFEQLLSTKFGSRVVFLTGVTAQYSGNLPQVDFYEKPVKPSDYTWFSTQVPAEYALLDLLGLGPYNFLNLGALADATFSFKKLTISAGLRADYREFYGMVLNPRLGAVVKLNNQNRLRFSSSTAYRPPSSYLIHSGVRGYKIDGQKFGLPSPNNNLGAEHLFNVDGGWAHEFSENHSLDFSAFYHINTNLISRTTSFSRNNNQLSEYYGYVNDANSSAQLLGFQVLDRLRFSLGSVQIRSDASLQIANGTEVLPFGRGSLAHYRMQPNTTLKWLLEVTPITNLYASVRVQYFSSWLTRSVVLAEIEEDLVAPAFYTIDLQLRYTFAKGKEVYLMVNNLTNNAYYGIGASGGAGVANDRVVYEDLQFNPQLLRVIKVGVRISFP